MYRPCNQQKCFVQSLLLNLDSNQNIVENNFSARTAKRAAPASPPGVPAAPGGPPRSPPERSAPPRGRDRGNTGSRAPVPSRASHRSRRVHRSSRGSPDGAAGRRPARRPAARSRIRAPGGRRGSCSGS